jgi:hypothetical protein
MCLLKIMYIILCQNFKYVERVRFFIKNVPKVNLTWASIGVSTSLPVGFIASS